MQKAHLWAAAVLYLGVECSVRIVGASQPIPTIEVEALKARGAIHSAEVVYVAERVLGNGSKERLRRHLWVSPDGTREDTTRPATRNGNYESSPSITEIKWRTKDAQVFWSDETLGVDRGVAVHYFDLPQSGRLNEILLPIDLRRIGFSPEDSANASKYDISSFVASPHRTSSTVKDIQWHDMVATEVTYEMISGTRIRMVFVPSMRSALALISAENSKSGITRSVVAENADFVEATPGHFFPTRFHYVRKHGDAVECKEEGRFKVISVNKPIDRAVFSLSTMGLPKGKRVTMFPSRPGGEYFWNGEKMVFSARALPPAMPANSSWPFYILAGAFAIVAASAVVMALRKRNRRSLA